MMHVFMVITNKLLNINLLKLCIIDKSLFHLFVIERNFTTKSYYGTEAELWEQLTTKVTHQFKLLIDYIKWHSLFYFSTKFGQIHITMSFCK